MQEPIRRTLYHLRITGNYRGTRQLACAVELVLEDDSRLLSVIREIYTPVAERCGCNVETIERNIRTVIFRVWHTRRKALIELAGYPMDAPPTVSEFIAILADYIRAQTISK